MSSHSTKTILITGANGQQGSAVLRHLVAKGHAIRAMVRKAESETATSLKQQGCEVVVADLDQPQTLPAALEDVDAAFLFLALSDQATELARGRNFIRAAAKTGLGYLVFSATLDSNHQTGVAHFDSKFELIQELRASEMHHTILGPGGFMENLLFPQTWNGLAKGKLVTPFAVDVPQALVAVDEIGRFAASLLGDPPEESGAFIPLYSEVLSSREQAALIGQQLGRPVKAKRLPWLLTRIFLGAQLTRMFDYFNRGQAPAPPGNEFFLRRLGSVTRFADWLSGQRFPG